MNFNLDPKINVNIQDRCLNWLDLNKTYNIIKLKPHKVGTKNILTQTMLLEPNTKYIILYNFDLDGKTIYMPKDCILEINGGDLFNGTLVGDNTILINTNQVDILLNNLTLTGEWQIHGEFSLENSEDIEYSSTNRRLKFADKEYNNSNFSGLGRIYLRKHIQSVASIEDKWFYKRGTDNLVYIFCVINNNFYYPYSNGIGLILNDDLVVATPNYDVNCLPPVVKNGISLELDILDNGIHIIFPKNVNIAGAYPLEDGRSYLTDVDLTRTSIYVFDNASIEYLDKNVLILDMISAENTRYIILYDYDLNNKTLTVPPGCALDFQGGSINNGTLIGNNTVINDPFDYIGNFVLADSDEESDSWKLHYKHKILSEEDFERMSEDERRSDTLYFITEE